jgi:acetylglutamate kinase
VSAPVTVLKLGGNEVDDPAWLARLAQALAERGGRALGAEPEWVDGLRVTSPEALKVVAMVLSGLVNKRLVAALLGAGVDAVGVSGEDGALLRARVAQGGALGRTGEVQRVRTTLLLAWLDQGLTPVLSPVSRGPDGAALNVNADDAAAAVAEALRADALLFVSNVPGVLAGGEVLPALDLGQVEALIADGTAQGGMAPKLRAAARAAGSTGAVRIGGLEMLSDQRAGTRVGAPAMPEASV